MFIASLVGVIVTVIHTLGVNYDFTLVELFVMALMPLVVAALLVWYSKHAESKAWIGTRSHEE